MHTCEVCGIELPPLPRSVCHLRMHCSPQDRTYVSPFAVERHQHMESGLMRTMTKPVGGKLDDVTAVVSIVAF